jgi:hypothetical protein
VAVARHPRNDQPQAGIGDQQRRMGNDLMKHLLIKMREVFAALES